MLDNDGNSLQHYQILGHLLTIRMMSSLINIMYKMRFSFMFIVCIFLRIEVYSQSDFRSGYIVNSDRDTVHGLIDYRREQLMGKICRFKLNEKDKIKIFNPEELTEYRFYGGKYYVSKEVNGQKTFLQFLVKGKLNLYTLRDNAGDHFFIEKSGFGLSELQYKEGIIYRNNVPYKFESTSHLGLLFNYTQDASDFRAPYF